MRQKKSNVTLRNYGHDTFQIKTACSVVMGSIITAWQLMTLQPLYKQYQARSFSKPLRSAVPLLLLLHCVAFLLHTVHVHLHTIK